MTLYDVVLKNLKHNIGKYAIYIASLVFSVLIYFTFVSLQYNEQISEAFGRDDKMGPLLSVVSVLLAVFMIVFVWYSNAFFITNRKQEIGLYSLVGGTKKEIGRMLFYENVCLCLLALGIGIGLGQLFSTFFSMILLKVMGISLVVHFSINLGAVVQTAFVFGAIMLIASLHGYLLVYRFRLIELFQAKHRVQTQWKPSYLLAVLALGLIGAAYWSLLHAYNSESWSKHFGRNMTLALIVLVAGSYLLFHTSSSFFVELWQRRKKAYYRWKNLLTLTQLKSRLKSNGLLLTVVSVLNGMTLVAFGFAYTMYFNTMQTLDDHVPYSYQLDVQSVEMNDEITKVLYENKEHPVLFDETFDYLMVPGTAEGLDTVPGGYFYYEESFAVLPVSTYNLLAEQLGRNEMNPIDAGETVMLGRNFIGSQHEEENVGRTVELTGEEGEFSFRVVENRIESLFSYDVQPSVLIVDNGMYERLIKGNAVMTTRVVTVDNQLEAEALTEDLRTVIASGEPKEDYQRAPKVFYSFTDSYQTAQSIYGLLVFVFGFMGLVFLIATGSVIYFKTLTEAAEDRRRYEILRKIGLSRRKVKQVIARQTYLLFLLPLLVGIAHSCVILGSLSKVMDIQFIYPVSICIAVYTCLYWVYYKMTVATANKLVNP
ncbi:ABC transporter permease [Sporosarcina sp. NCCP-2222]|uniref:ABC transporter permease n=1 Tax=Sporosarcina sp. NCCP-2222 TaxID=2935073 RepID=UPI00208D399E|nr:ABC transporter permease [Sporosarcina sp. NCCP-2222]GKV56120.1 ABC transporter permease [Sporosarcina sp. NCCP-2222]